MATVWSNASARGTIATTGSGRVGHRGPGVDVEGAEDVFTAPLPQLDPPGAGNVGPCLGEGDDGAIIVGGESCGLDELAREPQGREQLAGVVGDAHGGDVVTVDAGDGEELAVSAPVGIAHPATDVDVIDASTDEKCGTIEPLTFVDKLNALAVGPGALWVATGSAGILQRFDIPS
jgi:hypothetical protein